MKTDKIIKQWREFYEDHGVSNEVFSRYRPYIENLTRNNCPVIFEIEHLSLLLGIKRVALAKMVNSPGSFYRSFKIPKRKGGQRQIDAPYPSLLHCQRWIYENILLRQPVHDCVHGFMPGRSIITNASQHLSQNALLKMDLKDFFPSISINWVFTCFESLGFASNISFYLASLCCLDDCLSQGAATSPYLTNVLLLSLDNRLDKLSRKYGLTYTRYADDLTFSGNYIPHNLISVIEEIVEDFGLEVNKDKNRLHTKKGQRIVTGISVAGKTLKLPRGTRRELRKEAYYIKTYGYLSHANKIKIRNPVYLDSLEGKLNFWLQVEPESLYAKEAISLIRGIKEID